MRKVCYDTAAGTVKYERIYLGGYELYREYNTAAATVQLERSTHQVMDDQRMVALLEVKTVEGGTPIGEAVRSKVTRYQYTNHLDSAALELDESAKIISYEEYHPFGTTAYFMHTSDTDVSQKRYKYVHKERDDETGLYYYGARYYAPWLCRFVSVDPLKDKFPYYTTYQYAGNKPINAIDLDGLEEGPTALSGPPEMQQYTPYLDEHQYIDLDELQGVGDFLYDLNALGYNLMIAGTYNTASGLINMTASYAEASWVYGFEGGTLQLFESQMKAIKDSWVEAWDNTEFTWAGAFDSFTHVENYELAIGIILEEGVRGSLSTKSTPLRPPSSRHAPDLPSTKTKKYPAQQHYGSEFDGNPLPNRTVSQAFDAAKGVELSPNSIRFSQSSVNGADDLISSMKAYGWKGDPIDVVRMRDGGLTSIDNTRVLAAHEAGINVRATVRGYNDPLPSNLVERFTTKKGVPSTWGEAIEFRIDKQKATYRNNNPNGSMHIEGK